MPTSTALPSTPNVLANDGSYEVVVLSRSNQATRVIFRSPHYASALSYISRNLERRPWLDIVKDGHFVAWELVPELLGATA